MFLLETILTILFLLIPLLFSLGLNDKHNSIISDSEFMNDLTTFMYIVNHSGKHNSVISYNDAEALKNRTTLIFYYPFAQIDNKRYSELQREQEQSEDDYEFFYEKKLDTLFTKYKIEHSPNSAIQLGDRLEFFSLEKNRTPLIYSPYLIYIILLLSLLPQISLYENPRKIFKVLGVFILSLFIFLLFFAIFSTIIKIPFLNQILPYFFHKDIFYIVLIALFIKLLLNAQKNVKTRNSSLYIISIHLFTCFSLSYIFFYDKEVLILSFIGTAILFSFIGSFFNSLPFVDKKVKIYSKASQLLLRLDSKLVSKYPLLWETSIISSMIIVIIIGLVLVIMAYNHNEMIMKMGDGDAFSDMSISFNVELLFYFFAILVFFRIYSYSQNKLNLFPHENKLFFNVKLLSLISFILIICFSTIYTYNYIRLNKTANTYKEKELKEDIRNLRILDNYTTSYMEQSDHTATSKIKSLKLNYLTSGKNLSETWELDSLDKKKFSEDSLNTVLNIFHKYGVTLKVDTSFYELRNSDDYFKSRTALNNYLDYIISAKYFPHSENSKLFFFLYLILITSIIIFLQKTLELKYFGWIYTFFIILSLMYNFNGIKLAPNGFVSQLMGIAQLTSFLLFFYGIFSKNKPIVLNSYCFFIILFSIKYFKQIFLLKEIETVQDLYLFLPIFWIAIFILLHTFLQKKVFAKPFNKIIQ